MIKYTTRWYRKVIKGDNPLIVSEELLEKYLTDYYKFEKNFHLNLKGNSMLKLAETPNVNNNRITSKQKILDLVRKYIREHGPSLHAKQNTAPVSGKVVGEEEAVNLVEASLDLWLTAGKFNKKFEREMAKLLNVRYFLSCNSGSSANLLAMSCLM